MNRNSNIYTVIYAVVLCGLVAVLLSAAALGLKDNQNANTDNEKKQQILMAVAAPLGLNEISFENAAQLWDELKMDENMCMVNMRGEVVKDSNPFEVSAKSLFKGGVIASQEMPLYVANINGKPYYIMCMYGAGLWDAIWGYISVESDGSTIAGASFDHAGETAGLGAKIKDDPKFAEAFIGKKVFQNGEFAPVVVSKKNVDNKVDAITGATKTSDCVSVMIEESLKGYAPYLQTIVGGTADACCQEAEGECCGHCQESAEGECCGRCQEGAEGECCGKCQEGQECQDCPNKAE